MDVYGLVGKGLSHSRSPELFNKKFKDEGINAEYRLFDIDNPEQIKQILETPGLKGLNVTVPYKRSLSNYIDFLSTEVKQSGSINTIKVCSKHGELKTKAYNTDIVGFENSIKKVVHNKPGIRALVLGTGGSAHTVSYVFRKLGVFFYFISRKPAKVEHMSYNWITPKLISEYPIIVNCTPAGMYPNIDTYPDIPYEHMGSNNICFDWVYNPEETSFLKKAAEKGAQTITGKQLFFDQAKEAWKIWNRRY